MLNNVITHDFPTLGKEILERLHQLPVNIEWDITPHLKRLILRMKQQTVVDHQTAGRILLINGHCREQGIQLVVQCSENIKEQLSEYVIDRLCFIDIIEG